MLVILAKLGPVASTGPPLSAASKWARVRAKPRRGAQPDPQERFRRQPMCGRR
jgi:hypothetical protein